MRISCGWSASSKKCIECSRPLWPKPSLAASAVAPRTPRRRASSSSQSQIGWPWWRRPCWVMKVS
jgi:hypothetical protein